MPRPTLSLEDGADLAHDDGHGLGGMESRLHGDLAPPRPPADIVRALCLPDSVVGVGLHIGGARWHRREHRPEKSKGGATRVANAMTPA